MADMNLIAAIVCLVKHNNFNAITVSLGIELCVQQCPQWYFGLKRKAEWWLAAKQKGLSCSES
jgi:uncharacterized protein (DUF2237 family)